MRITKAFFIVVCAFLVAIFNTSCDEDLTSSPLSIDSMDTTVFRIYFRAELDLSRQGDETVPAGTAVTLTVPYSDYDAAGLGGSSRTSLVLTDTINADGYVEFSVPVDDDGVTPTVSIQGFVFDQIQGDASTVSKWYSLAATTYATNFLKIGATPFQELTMNAPSAVDEANPIFTANVVGYVTAELNLAMAGLETAPEGTAVRITSGDLPFDYDAESTLDANGQFSFEVPVVPSFDASPVFTVTLAPFMAEQTQLAGSDPATETVEFYEKTSTYTVNRGETETQNIAYDDPNNATPVSVELVTISGEILSEIDASNAFTDSLSNQTFIFHTDPTDGQGTDTWSAAVTTDANGQYSVDVPVGNDIYIACDLSLNRLVDDGAGGTESEPSLLIIAQNVELMTAMVSVPTAGVDITLSGWIVAP